MIWSCLLTCTSSYFAKLPIFLYFCILIFIITIFLFSSFCALVLSNEYDWKRDNQKQYCYLGPQQFHERTKSMQTYIFTLISKCVFQCIQQWSTTKTLSVRTYCYLIKIVKQYSWSLTLPHFNRTSFYS